MQEDTTKESNGLTPSNAMSALESGDFDNDIAQSPEEMVTVLTDDEYMLDLFGEEVPDEASELIPSDEAVVEDKKTVEEQLTNDKPLLLTEQGHVRAVRFLAGDSNHYGLPKFFAYPNTKDWEKIPPFVVLTGVNGSGKTTVFEYLKNMLDDKFNNRRENTNKVIYIGPDKVLFANDSYSSSTDNAYHIRNQSRFEGLMAECRYKLSLGVSLPKGDNEVTQICHMLQQKLQGQPVTDDLIRTAIQEYVPRVHVNAEDPLMHLTHVENQYQNRIKAFQDALNRVDAVCDLYEYYQKFFHELNALIETDNDTCIGMQEFVKFLRDNQNFKLKLIMKTAIEKSGLSPLMTVNQVLEKYGFKYRLQGTKAERNREEVKLTLTNADIPSVKPEKISSGERMILSIMSWLYYQQDAGQPYPGNDTDNKIRVLLLDEPDRHLDPKLAKLFFHIMENEISQAHGVQVIMSTHRFDSLAYANKQSIYCIQQNDTTREIVPCSRMDAIFRMTSNIRELAAYERRIYTESIRDAQFYEGVYHSLVNFFPKKDTNDKDWYLSRRHRLSFHTVSKKTLTNLQGKADGGCEKVVSRIEEDDNAIDNLSKQPKNKGISRWNKVLKLIDEPDLLRSFGVLDSDYGATENLIQEHRLQDRIAILQRYSLENFCLDPIVFCSVLEENDIEYYINKIKIIGDDSYSWLRDILYTVCINIKNALAEGDYSTLQEFTSRYFFILLPVIAIFCVTKGEDTKRQTRAICDSILHRANLINEKDNLTDEDFFGELQKDLRKNDVKRNKSIWLKKLFDANAFEDNLKKWVDSFIRTKNQNAVKFVCARKNDGTEQLDIFELSYPDEFLQLRGHTIEDVFDNVCPSDQISEMVYDQGLTCVSFDLIDLFNTLNEKVKKNVRQVKECHATSLENAASKEEAPRQSVASSNTSGFFNANKQSPSASSDKELLLRGLEEAELAAAIERSLKDQQERETLRENLKNEAVKFGYECFNVSGKGNCFFDAMAHQFSLMGEKYSHQQLRGLLHNYLLEHWYEFDGFTEDESIYQFINRMKRDGTWANDMAITAMARALKVTIAIINSDGSDPIIKRIRDATVTFFLGYEINWHYQSLVDGDQGETEKDIQVFIEAADFIDAHEESLPISSSPSLSHSSEL